MTVFVFSDNANTTLASALSAGATTATLAPGTGNEFPSPAAGQSFTLTLNDAATRTLFETAYCTARTGDVLTLVRGQEGTTARNWQIGDLCWNGPTGGTMANMVQFPNMEDASISPIFNALLANVITSNGAITAGARLSASIGARALPQNVNTATVLNDFSWAGTVAPSGGGFFIIPATPANFIFQWGLATTSGAGQATVNYPTAFPNNALGVVACIYGNNTNYIPSATVVVQLGNQAAFLLTSGTASGVSGPISAIFLAWGY